jgi:LysM repeat protein
LFWHPLFWWLQHQLRFAGEVLADDHAARGSVGDYVRCMLELAATPTPRVAATFAAPVFHRSSELYRRLQMMLQKERVCTAPTSSWRRFRHSLAAAAIVLTCAATFGVERAVAQEPDTGRALAREIADMRATIQALKTELVALQDRNRTLETTASEKAELERILGRQAGPQPPRAARQDAVADPLTAGPRPPRAAKPDAGVPPAANGSPGRTSTYTVKNGDTLDRIARQFYTDGDGERLLRLNPGLDPQRLRIGQRLVIDPPADTAADPTTPTQLQPESADARPAGKTSLRSPTGAADLVTRCIELRGEVEIAEIGLARAAEAQQNGAESPYEVRIAEVKLRTKRDQHKTLESMLRDELESAMRERKAAAALARKGYVSDADVDRLDNLIKLLKRAL